MPVSPAPTQPVLVLNPYTGRHLDVQPLLAFMDQYCPTRKAGDPGNVADMLQEVLDFLSVNTRPAKGIEAGTVLEELSDASFTLIEMRKVFATMREVG